MRPQPWLAPLSPLFLAGVQAKNCAYDLGVFQQKKLGCAVISVGNLSTGGTGKTPFVIALAQLLSQAGIPVDILSRGYGRSSTETEQVDPGPASLATRFGDEPLLLARETHTPVYVGRSRYKAGLLAEREAGHDSGAGEDATRFARIHLLDDGFQHRQLVRDLDIVLVHRDDLHARMLPAGHLREPLASLRRAQVIVLREEDQALEEQLRPYAAEAAIWHVRRQVIAPPSPGPYLAFSGIARPDEFFSALSSQLSIAAHISFPDHHRYNSIDLDRLSRQATKSGVTRFVTTAKDLVRLNTEQLSALRQTAPVEVADLQLTIVEADAALSLIRRL
jgi:tetraacyldisaccharide 4'-kinase